MVTVFLVFSAIGNARDIAQPASVQGIRHIGQFLDQCPDRDPAYATIMNDFEIRRDGALTSTPPCTEPVSAMPVTQYTDELIVRQGLRVIYYMDRGLSGHLPWTAGSLYDWMRTKIGGLNIITGMSGGGCCSTIAGRTFVSVGSQNDFNREFDKTWRGISGNIDFYAHEARHVDGYPHSSCCGIPGGCDEVFDPSHLGSYGVQWWLEKLWLDGVINVGYECLSQNEISETTSWFLSGLNNSGRFCVNVPATVTAPPIPGGTCPLASPGHRRRAARP